MAEAESKRQRRTPQERANELDEKITKINQSINELEEKKKTVVEEYDAKITAAKERIKSLEAKKQEILAPKAPRKPRKTKKQKIQEIVKLAMKNGMSVEEVASQLHVEVESKTVLIEKQHRLECIRTMLLFMVQADYSTPLIFR